MLAESQTAAQHAGLVFMQAGVFSGRSQGFVHPRIVQSMEAQPSEGAVLTVTVANGT